MYYPYYRGKQYELISIKESSINFQKANICCVIEPVKENLLPLERSLNVLIQDKNKFIIIVNPEFGDFKDNNLPLLNFIKDKYKNYKNLYVGYLINTESSFTQIENFFQSYSEFKKVIIHKGFSEGKELAKKIKNQSNLKKHLFIENFSNRLYQKHFSNNEVEKIIVSDGFKKRKNREYPKEEEFSELNVLYNEIGYDGFGDYLVVGDNYSETGGPAYTIAIHITYIGSEGQIKIMHFKSDRTESPTDPAGKFLEALRYLVDEVRCKESRILKTKSIQEFLKLYEEKHFPGLGYLKKLALNHHIELLADLNS